MQPDINNYTVQVFIDSDGGSFEALVRPDTDYDGRFTAYDTDNQEWIRVNGHNCTVN